MKEPPAGAGSERPPELTTNRLLLRAARVEDADDIYRNINDWDVVRMIARPPWPYPRELADEFVRTTSAAMIVYEGEVIGAVSVGGGSRGFNLGYWMGKRHWGKGLMTEAAAARLAAFYAEAGDVPVYSGYLDENPASWRVQAKLGFVPIGAETVAIASRGGGAVAGTRTLLTRRAFKAMQKC